MSQKRCEMLIDKASQKCKIEPELTKIFFCDFKRQQFYGMEAQTQFEKSNMK